MSSCFSLPLIATPQGIMLGNEPLAKSAKRGLPSYMQHYIERAEALLKQVKPEDWDDRTPHPINDVPMLAKVQMMLALANPIVLDKRGYNSDEARVPAGHHHESGEWTSADGVTAADLKNPHYKGMSHIQIKKQKFVDMHIADTEKAAKQLNVPVANILGLAALESGWGKGDFVNDGPTAAESTNSYFGMAAPVPFMNGTTQAADSNHMVASFASQDALNAFVATKGGIIRNISDPQQFATAIQLKGKFGIDMNTGKFDPTYIPKLTSTIKHISSAVAYAQEHRP